MTLFHCFKIDSDCCSFNEFAAVTAVNSIFNNDLQIFFIFDLLCVVVDVSCNQCCK
jgi:hypothetical protein